MSLTRTVRRLAGQPHTRQRSSELPPEVKATGSFQFHATGAHLNPNPAGYRNVPTTLKVDGVLNFTSVPLRIGAEPVSDPATSWYRPYDTVPITGHMRGVRTWDYRNALFDDGRRVDGCLETMTYDCASLAAGRHAYVTLELDTIPALTRVHPLLPDLTLYAGVDDLPVTTTFVAAPCVRPLDCATYANSDTENSVNLKVHAVQPRPAPHRPGAGRIVLAMNGRRVMDETCGGYAPQISPACQVVDGKLAEWYTLVVTGTLSLDW